MSEKAGSSSSSAPKSNAPIVRSEEIDRVADLIRRGGRPLEALALAQQLTEALTEPSAVAEKVRVKVYDHRCDFQEGDRVYVDNRYGKSLATITRIIRQPPQAFCDKAFLEFDDAAYRSRWEEERSTPYFAIHSGRLDNQPSYIEVAETAPAPRRPRMNSTATAKLARALETALDGDSRFTRTIHGWQLTELIDTSAPRPHIQAEPGGKALSGAPLPQGYYKAPVLEVIDRMGEATIEEIKRNIQAKLNLGAADWETDATGKIVWIHRLHAAIKHLKRVGSIDSPRRQVYRRIRLQRETA